MKKEILLSICIPTFNREAILEPILNSIFQNLNYDWIEVVVVDDNPQDINPVPFAYFEKKWKNFKYFKNTNRLGVVKNITNCMELASGCYITLLKDTDYINHELVLKLKDSLEKRKINSVFTGVSFKENGEKFTEIKQEKRLESINKIRDIVSIFRAHGTPGFILKKDKLDFLFLKNNETDPANIYAQTIAGIMVALQGNVLFVKEDLNFIYISPKHSLLASYYSEYNPNSNWNLNLEIPYTHPENGIVILKYIHNKLNELANNSRHKKLIVKKMIGYQLAYHYIYTISNYNYSNKEKRQYFNLLRKIKDVEFYFIFYFFIKYSLKKVRVFFKIN